MFTRGHVVARAEALEALAVMQAARPLQPPPLPATTAAPRTAAAIAVATDRERGAYGDLMAFNRTAAVGAAPSWL